MDGTFKGREVLINGRRGWVLKDYWSEDRFDVALIRLNTEDATGDAFEVVRGLEALEAILLPLPDDDESTGVSVDPFLDDLKAESEEESSHGGLGAGPSQGTPPERLPAKRRSATNIAMPLFGTSDECYVQSPTGKWFSRSSARKETDVPITAWIDMVYPKKSVWPVEYLVDDRINSEGEREYLVKFLGYELNPGVDGDGSNYGDWYTEKQDVDPADVKVYRRRKKSGMI